MILNNMDKIHAIGRRKHSIARVYLKSGKGIIKINNKDYKDYFPTTLLQYKIEQSQNVVSSSKDFDVHVNVIGGGLTGQSDAIKQGAARALCELSTDNRKPLKTEGHLSRDPRAKERRKYGLKKARKAPQFSKR